MPSKDEQPEKHSSHNNQFGQRGSVEGSKGKWKSTCSLAGEYFNNRFHGISAYSTLRRSHCSLLVDSVRDANSVWEGIWEEGVAAMIDTR